MRILSSTELLHPIGGGAEVSLQTLLSFLSRSNSVRAVYTGREPRSVPYETSAHSLWLPVPLLWLREYYFNIRWEKILGREMRKYDPDLVLTQLHFTPSTARIAKRCRTPLIVFVRSYEHICPTSFFYEDPFSCERPCWRCGTFKDRLQHPFFSRLIRGHEAALKSADMVVSNSDYMSRVVEHFYGVKSTVIRPFIDLSTYLTERSEGGAITFIRPEREKGVGTVLELSRRMPKRKFLVVGRGADADICSIKAQKNIEYIPRARDMREVYSRTRLLLMPSVWPEPFGRACLEAGVNGIPTIASKTGGLPESLGKGGIIIEDYMDVSSWEKSIERLEDESEYERLSAAAKTNASGYDLTTEIEKFKGAVRARTGLEL